MLKRSKSVSPVYGATEPLDIQIPFDEKAVTALFDQGKDYVLQYAGEYLKKENGIK